MVLPSTLILTFKKLKGTGCISLKPVIDPPKKPRKGKDPELEMGGPLLCRCSQGLRSSIALFL